MVIDFHSHFLPKVDDGSDSVKTSLEMLSLMRASGVDTVVSTSHFYASRESAEAFLVRRNEAFEKLKAEAGVDLAIETEKYPQVLLGAEVAFYYGISATEDLRRLAFESKDVSGPAPAIGAALLIEMPFKPWGEFEYNTLSSLIYSQGFKVILAHYERYDYMQKKEIADKILGLPLYIQINSEALLSKIGSKKYINMFKDGKAHLLGSDSHNLSTRTPNLMAGRKVIENKLGQECLNRIDNLGRQLLNMNTASPS